jgi:hypothetical protein
MYLPLTLVDGQSKFDRGTNGVICIYPILSSMASNNTFAHNQTKSCASIFSFHTCIYLTKFLEKIINFSAGIPLPLL